MGRYCSKCREHKESTEYYSNTGYCKPCAKDYYKNRNTKSKKTTDRQARLTYERDNSVKTCTACKVEKSFDDYRKTPNGQHGCNSQCKACDSTRTAKAKQQRPQHYKEWQTKYNKNYSKQRSLVDPVFSERRSAVIITGRYLRKGQTSNGRANAFIGCSRPALIQHLHNSIKDPVVASKWVQSGFSGTVLEIDHIVPLSTAKNIGEVHSLMHYTNLQMLSRSENINKGTSLL
jgi:hypothetical protein